MKRFALLAIVCTAHTAHAEIVTVPINGVVTKAFGTPFGVTFEPNVTPVTGSFKYDTAIPPIAFSSVDSDFLVSIPNGFVLYLPGVILSSSNYNINLINDNNRLFDIVGIQSGASGHGSDFRVNGVPAPQGGVYVYLADVDNTIFPNSNSLRMLPTQSQVINLRDVLPLMYCMILLGDSVGGHDSSTCTWSADTAPCRISISFVRHTSRTSSRTRSPTAPVSTFFRYFVTHTKWYLRSKRLCAPVR